MQTDHWALTWLMTNNNLTGKLARWSLRLQEFGKFPIEYRFGSQHGNADGLSRMPMAELPLKAPSTAVEPPSWRSAPDPDPFGNELHIFMTVVAEPDTLPAQLAAAPDERPGAAADVCTAGEGAPEAALSQPVGLPPEPTEVPGTAAMDVDEGVPPEIEALEQEDGEPLDEGLELADGEPEDEELELADDSAYGYPREPRQNITLDFDVLAALKADPEDMLAAIPASQTRRVLLRIKNYEWVDSKLYRKATLHSARREVPPILERLPLVQEIHSTKGHYKVQRTLSQVQAQFWWYGMSATVWEICEGCDDCKRSKPRFVAPPELRPIPVESVWERLHIDLAGPFAWSQTRAGSLLGSLVTC